MKPFLKSLAEEIAARFSSDPGQLCVVLPNRRAGLYLKKYLSQELKKTAWSPQTFSVEDFITTISGFQVMDQAGLLFELYSVHKEIAGEQAQEFETFTEWGQTLLQDFDEIDQYLAEPDKIFQYLNEIRAMTVWNLGEQPLTDHEKKYIAFYQSFNEYYVRLKDRLTGKKTLYRGLAYRMAAENIEKLVPHFTWNKILFAGLNALVGAEEKIIDFLVRREMAEIYWDAERYYIDNEEQESGEFIRSYLQKWPADRVRWIEDNFRNTEKEIKVFGIPLSMGQAMKASQLINLLKAQGEQPDMTALVLADEKLLLPVLYSIPEDFGPVNVTMGYPLKYTPLYQLIHFLFQMQVNREKFRKQRPEAPAAFYVKDVLKLISHPYFYLWENTTADGQLSMEAIAQKIRIKNKVFLTPEELLSMWDEMADESKVLLANAFSVWSSPVQAPEIIMNILEIIRDRMISASEDTGIDHVLDMEYLYQFSKIINRCRSMMEEYPFIITLNSLSKVLFQIIDSTRLPFYGEPLQGMQVMGVLETRAIDFENLIVLSVNEGVLPSGRTPNSFIPFEVKVEFGLPTYRQKDAVFAYHFYRMIQRARKIFLLYDTEGDQFKGGEKSRFITQIAYELPRYNPRIVIDEQLLGPQPPSGNIDNPIQVMKTPGIMKKLEEKAEKGFSPSALNVFIRCPLQFYYQEVVGLSEAEEIEETIEAKTMGTVVHAVLQRIFKPFEDKFVDPQALTEKLKYTESYLADAFHVNYKGGDLEYGKNHLIYKVSLFLINQFIRSEAAKLKLQENPSGTLKIISLEKNLESRIICKINGHSKEIKIKGKADRIDQWNGTIRVIDYKTGYVSKEELKLESWEDLIREPKMAKAFQLLLYAFLFAVNDETHDGLIETGNITFRKISEGFMKVRLPEDQCISREAVKAITELLAELLGNIFDQEQPFAQTEDAENCEYCPFRSICTR